MRRLHRRTVNQDPQVQHGSSPPLLFLSLFRGSRRKLRLPVGTDVGREHRLGQRSLGILDERRFGIERRWQTFYMRIADLRELVGIRHLFLGRATTTAKARSEETR